MVTYMMADVATVAYQQALTGDLKAHRFLAEIGGFIKAGMGNVVVNNVQPVVDVDVDDASFMEKMDRIARERGWNTDKPGEEQ